VRPWRQQHQKSLTAPNSSVFAMSLRKSERKRKAVTIWEEKEAPSAANDPIIPRKAARTEPETALKAIATGPLPGTTKIDSTALPELPEYLPPLELHYKPSESIATGLSELHTFQQLFTQEVVDIIVNATNSYAENAREKAEIFQTARSWDPVNSTDIWRYFGCLLYMGEHGEKESRVYWSSLHQLGQFLSLSRFEQIHRYLAIRDESVHPRQDNENFAWKLEPVGTIIRRNCKQNWFPSSHICIDEAMIPFRGRSHHTVKLPHKPISEGYKVWILGDNGYAYDWLWHSGDDGPEGIPKKGITTAQRVPNGPKTVHLAPTFALIIRLAERLREYHPQRIFCLFLDNLFLNTTVAHALLAMNICCMGTTRKNAQGVPPWLVEMKNNNHGLVWNSTLGEVVGYTLCFLWQDNNAVLGITTAYRLNETVECLRKRPSPTSTNARIVRPVFGDLVEKKLFIPRAINEYNHHMNGVDRNNQLRKHLSVHRAFERRIWVPQLYFMVDICVINSYLIWKGKKSDTSHHSHRQYHSTLAQACLQVPYSDRAVLTANSCRRSIFLPSINVEAPSHAWKRWEKRGHCVWCKTHVEKWVPKRPSIMQEIVNEASQKRRTRQSQSWGGCQGCSVYLCQKGPCIELFHSQKHQN